MKYEVGQMVTCIGNFKSHIIQGYGWEKGLTYKITSISITANPSGSGDCQCLFGGNDTHGVYEEFVQHATWKDRYSHS